MDIRNGQPAMTATDTPGDPCRLSTVERGVLFSASRGMLQARTRSIQRMRDRGYLDDTDAITPLGQAALRAAQAGEAAPHGPTTQAMRIQLFGD